MMGFDVICTNPSNKSSVKFCVGEVFEDRGGISMGRIGEASVQAWGCPRHPKQIFKETQVSMLGDAPEGIPSF